MAKQPYELNHVDGIESFGGSAAAQELLATNGFVVAAPDFRQIFEPYIESPLPVFITPDSAWHTYHFLLEQGLKEMERAQSERLAVFSRRLLTAASEQASNGVPEFRDLEHYASIGLAFQDATYAASLGAEQRGLVETLVVGTEPVQTSIGFALSPVTFRAESFYAESPELTAYYRARQWYANVDFRLNDDRETRLAIRLSWLVQSDPELRKLWHELTMPYDTLVALPEDATVNNYFQVATNVLNGSIGLTDLKEREVEILKSIRAKPMLPRINDQQLSPGEYLQFPQLTAGFRLLPARQLPCAVCLQNTVDPKIRGRFCPSGLDFFAGSAVLRSAAALRAEERQAGKTVLAGVLMADSGPMPDSLYGRSMTLLTSLQKPLPSHVPAPFRTPAWFDLQLWTQLGAWAEQRHTWALHAKPNWECLGMAETPPGIVAPYPDFFAGLANLSRQTAYALETNIIAEQFDAKRMAAEIIKAQETLAQTRSRRNTGGAVDEKAMEISASLLGRYEKFIEAYRAKHPTDTKSSEMEIPSDILKRCAASGPANDSEREMLQLYFNSAPPTMAVHLTDFAAVCDRLAGLAAKELAGKTPTPDEAQWISSYGETLAGFHLYQGNSWLNPDDDFPIVSRIFGIPITSSVLYAGVARPQALYVILPYKDRMQLYRGAVMSYREFERPEQEKLDDAGWLAMVRNGNVPPPPLFTTSFMRVDEPGPDQTNRIRSLSFADQDLAKPALLHPVKLKIKQTVLAPAPVVRTSGNESLLMSSDDERHAIYMETKDGSSRVVRDGVPGKEYKVVDSQWLSPDSKHVVYLAKNEGHSFIVMDGIEGKHYANIQPIFPEESLFSFSADSVHFAYAAVLESGQQCIVVDGAEGPAYERILPNTFSFSQNSRHFVYVAARGEKAYVLKDNKVVLEGDASGWDGNQRGPYLSPNGERLACIVRRGWQWFVNVDGIESPPWDQIGNLGRPAFSADGRHFAYSAGRSSQMCRVIDGQEIPGWSIEGVVFSPNGTNWATVQEHETGSSVVVNEKPGKKYRGGILELTFSPDGRRLGYFVEQHFGGGPAAVIHGEQEFEDVEPQLFTGIRFSPDSKHFAISGKRGRKAVVIVDGKQYPSADNPELSGSEVTFSPNGDRWAYPAFNGGRQYWIVSGVEYGPYGVAPNPNREFDQPFNAEEANLFFSPDGRHFAFRTTRDGRHYLVFDGSEIEISGEWFPHSVIIFDSPTAFHFLVLDEHNIRLVEAEAH